MSNKLEKPVVVAQGIARAECTHAHFGATLQRWSHDAPLVSYEVLGALDGEGRFTAVEGTRADTGALSTTQAQWTAGDYEWLAAKPEMKKALARMKARHDWIVAGRPEAGEPA